MGEPGPSNAYYQRFASTADGPIRPPSPPGSPLLRADQTAVEFLDTENVDSLYAVLNVTREASIAEIKESYRSLAAVYHPDKQRRDDLRTPAHSRFTEIQRAYEVLTDPTKRTVYDMFGEEGLRTSWEVGPKAMTSEQLRNHFQRQAYTKRQIDAEALVKSKGEMSVVLDARAVFVPKTMFKHPNAMSHSPIARIQRVRPGQILMKHSFETPIDDNTQIVWEGTMAARSGAGGANISGTVKHQFSPRLWVQFSQSILSPRISSAKATYTFDENTYVTSSAIAQTFLAPPRISVTLGRRLYSETTGFITFKSGFWSIGRWGDLLPPQLYMADRSALTIGMTNARRNGSGWTIETQTGLAENAISADWSTRVLGLTVKLGASADLSSGISGFADATGHVTEHVRAGLILQVELQGGVQLRLKFSRVGQRITIPILLSQDINPLIIFFSALLPAASYATFHHFYLLPRKRRAIAQRIQQLRDEHADYIEQKRAEAHEAVLVMERSVVTKTIAEREKNGLVVLSAHYGLSTAFTPLGLRDADDVVIDVTVPVQSLVLNSRLFIPGGRAKFNLLGFYDPCIGENKKLRVRYLFRGKVHEVTVDDVSMLRAPVKSHAIDD